MMKRDESETLDATRIEQIATLLGDCGYRAKIGEAGSISSMTSGLRFILFPFQNNTIQLTCLITKDEDIDFSAEQANRFNSEYRYAKVYLDEDGDILISWDLLFDPYRDDAEEELSEIISIYDSSLGLLRDAMTRAATQSPDEIKKAASE